MLLQHDIEHIIKLSQNENPYGASPMALKAIDDSYHSIHRYPAFIPAVLKYKLAAEHHLSAENIVVGAGSVEIIDLVIKSLSNVDEEVIASEKSFMAYQLLAKNNRRVCKIAKMEEHTINLDNIEALCTEKTKVIFIANPNNPTGTIVTQDAFEKFLANISPNIYVVIDEAYIDYVNDISYPNSLKLRKKYPNLIIIRTFSKIHGLAALRIGYSIATKEISALIESFRTPFSVTTLGVAAAMASIDDHDFIRECTALNEKEREYLHDEMNDLGLKVVKSQGNFIFLECESEEHKQHLYDMFKEKGFLVRTLEAFGIATGLRISVGMPEDNRHLIECLRQF